MSSRKLTSNLSLETASAAMSAKTAGGALGSGLRSPLTPLRESGQLSARLRSASFGAVQVLSARITNMSSNPKHHWRAVLGEFLGTSVFIFLAMAAGLLSDLSGDKDSVASNVMRSAVITGGALTALIFSLSHISGGHLNPAVTLCVMSVRAIPVSVGTLYIVAQLLGSLAATGFYMIVDPRVHDKRSASELGLSPAISAGPAFFLQLIVSSLLCWVVLATGVDSHGGEPRNFLAALPIGISVGVGVMVAAPFIGASMNPAGAFGPLVAYGNWEYAWIYLIGPLVAALIVGLLYKLVFMTRHTGLSPWHMIKEALSRSTQKQETTKPAEAPAVPRLQAAPGPKSTTTSAATSAKATTNSNAENMV